MFRYFALTAVLSVIKSEKPALTVLTCGVQTFQPHTPPTANSSTTYIVGGREAVPHSWPWQVVLRFRTSTLTCSGSIVRTASNELVIITAAQCVVGTLPSDWKVDTGVHSRSALEANLKTYSVSTIISHASFNPFYFDNDIAILRVTPAIVENDYTIPICVTSLPSSDFFGKECVVTGWGATVEGPNIALGLCIRDKVTGKFNETKRGLPTDKLKEVYKPVLSDMDCMINVGPPFNPDHMTCAGYLQGDKGACSFDTGGPLACKNVNGQYDLIGLVSWGFGCARERLPAVYTNIHKYLDWITNNTISW